MGLTSGHESMNWQVKSQIIANFIGTSFVKQNHPGD
jgi:hypothetical protein